MLTAIEQLYTALKDTTTQKKDDEFGFIIQHVENMGYKVIAYPLHPEKIESSKLTSMQEQLEQTPQYSDLLNNANNARNNDATKTQEIAKFNVAEKEMYLAAQNVYSTALDNLEEDAHETGITKEEAIASLKTFREMAFAKTFEEESHEEDDEVELVQTREALGDENVSGGPLNLKETPDPLTHLREIFAGQLTIPKKGGAGDEENAKPLAGNIQLPPNKPGIAGDLSLPKSKSKPFPASPSNSGAHRIRMITWTRAYYGLNESHVLYPLSFAKARTAQTDSNEFMKFFNQFLNEINVPRGNVPVPPKAALQAALYDLQNTEITYPYNTLKEVLLRSSDPEPNNQRDPALYEYIRWIRLNQYSRNSFPYGFETEDGSEYLSERMNKFGWGSRPRAEMEASLQNAIDFYGVGMREEGKGNYTVTQTDDDGNTHNIIKVHVAEHGGKVTFDLQPGIADENREGAIKHMMTMHASHIQQNGSNSFEAKLGGRIYDNIRMLQLALYDHNFHVTFKVGAKDALLKMESQIDALDITDAEKEVLKDEVNWLISHAQTFDSTIPRSGSKVIAARCYADKATNRILNPEEVQEAVNAGKAKTLSLKETQQLFLARSKEQVGKIYPPKAGPTPPTTAPLEASENMFQVGLKRLGM